MNEGQPIMKTMKNKQCSSSKKHYGWFYYPRLFLLVLMIWPIVLLLTLTRRLFIYLRNLFLRRPMIKEPIHLIRAESVDDFNDLDYEQKKTQEWLKNFDDPQILENARYICEYTFHLNLKANPPYNEYDDPLV